MLRPVILTFQSRLWGIATWALCSGPCDGRLLYSHTTQTPSQSDVFQEFEYVKVKGLGMQALPLLASLALEIPVELNFPPTLKKDRHSQGSARLNTCSIKHSGALVNTAWKAYLHRF